MTTNIQEVVGILDRSGSMAGKEEDTVGGINSMISVLKKNANTSDIINVSIKLFDHEEKLLWNSKPLSEVTSSPRAKRNASLGVKFGFPTDHASADSFV